MNAIGSWQSVNEGVFFRSALDKPWISLALFSARGIEKESYESFLDYRHRPPQDSFIQKPEYQRRATEGELLLLSVSPPHNLKQTKDIIMHRNWIACNLADVVFIGGAERASLQWSAKVGKLTPRRQKTFALAKQLVKSKIPIFTVDHPDNMDLIKLGVPGYRPDTITDYLIGLGAEKGKALRENKTVQSEIKIPEPNPYFMEPKEEKFGVVQTDLFREPPPDPK